MTTARAAAPGQELDTAALESALRGRVDGEVRFDAGSRGAYSTDASNYRQVPIGVVVPRTRRRPAPQAVAVCAPSARPCCPGAAAPASPGSAPTPRSSSTGPSTATAWSSVDPEARTCVVEPGIVLDDLNRAARRLRPDVRARAVHPQPLHARRHDRQQLLRRHRPGVRQDRGQRAAPGGPHLRRHPHAGSARPRDRGVRGVVAATAAAAPSSTRACAARRPLPRPTSARGYPDIPRRVSGYNLDSAAARERGFDLARALVGTRGHLRDRPARRARPGAGARRQATAGRSATPTSAPPPTPYPRSLRHAARASWRAWTTAWSSSSARQGAHLDALDALPEGGGWLMVQFTGDDQDAAGRAGRTRCCDALRPRPGTPRRARSPTDPAQEERLLKVREAGLGATAPPAGRRARPGRAGRTPPSPPERLGDYLRDLRELFDGSATSDASLYGHFGQGCVHTRIPFDLRTADGRRRSSGRS